MPEEKSSEPQVPKDPGRWTPTGVCKACRGPVFTRFPTRNWINTHLTFFHLHVCPACDLISFEGQDART